MNMPVPLARPKEAYGGMATAATAAAQWQRPPVTVKVEEEVLRVRHGVVKVLRRSIQVEGGQR
jgi:hypothetical protein